MSLYKYVGVDCGVGGGVLGLHCGVVLLRIIV